MLRAPDGRKLAATPQRRSHTHLEAVLDTKHEIRDVNMHNMQNRVQVWRPSLLDSLMVQFGHLIPDAGKLRERLPRDIPGEPQKEKPQ